MKWQPELEPELERSLQLEHYEQNCSRRALNCSQMARCVHSKCHGLWLGMDMGGMY